jgi:hypothetical protein
MAAALLVATLAGCGGSREDGPPAERRPSFSSQVAAVRGGTATAIVAATPPGPDDWASVRGLGGLRELVLENGGGDDRAAEILATLPDLERLVLRRCPLTDAGFKSLSGCPRLRDLNVPQAACTAAGVRSLAAVASLRSLRLGGETLAGPEVGAAVAELTGLRSLHLIDVPLGDRGLAALGRLEGLWNLYLDGAGVSDEAWVEYFRACPGVHVHVDQAHHDRDPSRHDTRTGR